MIVCTSINEIEITKYERISLFSQKCTYGIVLNKSTA